MAADLLNGSGAGGTITVGGTESNLLAVLAARNRARAERPHDDWARDRRRRERPPVVQQGRSLPRRASEEDSVRDDTLADAEAMREAITDNTGPARRLSARVFPRRRRSYPEIAAIAVEHRVRATSTPV